MLPSSLTPSLSAPNPATPSLDRSIGSMLTPTGTPSLLAAAIGGGGGVGGGSSSGSRLICRLSQAPVAGIPLQASIIALDDSSVVSAEDHGDKFTLEWAVEAASSILAPPTASTSCACPFCPRRLDSKPLTPSGRSSAGHGAAPPRWLACSACIAARLKDAPPPAAGVAAVDMGPIAFYCSARCMARHYSDHARARHACGPVSAAPASPAAKSGEGSQSSPVLCDDVAVTLARKMVSAKAGTNSASGPTPRNRADKWAMGPSDGEFRISTPASLLDDTPGVGEVGWRPVTVTSGSRMVPRVEHEGRCLQLCVRYKHLTQTVQTAPVLVPPAFQLHHHRCWTLPSAIASQLPQQYDNVSSVSLVSALPHSPLAKALISRARPVDFRPFVAPPPRPATPAATTSAAPQPQPAPIPPNALRVLSFNVLADLYCTPASYPYAPAWALSWAYRYPRVLATLLSQSPHILCLQEVQKDVYHDQLAPALAAAGYAGVWHAKTRTGVGENGIVDGVATFVHASAGTIARVTRIEFNTVARAKAARAAGMSPEAAAAATTQAMLSILGASNPAAAAQLKRLSKDNVALLTLLEITLPSAAVQRLLVVNTHLTWDPVFADVKLWQCLELLSAVQDFRAVVAAERPGTPPLPVVMAGDFNSEPSSAVYSVLAGYGHQVARAVAAGALQPTATAAQVSGLLQYVSPVPAVSDADLPEDPNGILPPPGEMVHNLPLISAYAAVTAEEAPYTNHTQSYSGCIDYVWVSLESLCPVAAWAIPHKDNLFPPAMAAAPSTASTVTPRTATTSSGGSLLHRSGSMGDATAAAANGAAAGGGGGGGSGGGPTGGGTPGSHDIWGSGQSAHPYGDFTKLPSVYHPSDHLPLLFDVIMGCPASALSSVTAASIASMVGAGSSGAGGLAASTPLMSTAAAVSVAMAAPATPLPLPSPSPPLPHGPPPRHVGTGGVSAGLTGGSAGAAGNVTAMSAAAFPPLGSRYAGNGR